MLVLIFSFFAVFSEPTAIPARGEPAFANSDSVKRLSRKHLVSDTTRTGRFLTVNRIYVTGNKRTRNRIIKRELSVKENDVVYSGDLESYIDLDRKKLLNTRLFNTVEIRSLEIGGDKVDLLVDVTERWYTFPAPILELADRNFNEWWQNYDHDLRRLNYGLRLYQYNMRGRNETLRLHAQFGFNRRMEIMYRFPYIDQKQKQGLSFDFSFGETKNLAYKTDDHKYVFLRSDDILRLNRGAGVSWSYRNNFYRTHGVRLEYFRSEIKDTIRDLNPIYLKSEKGHQQYATVSYTFNADHRDFVAYPLKGHQFTFTATRNGFFPSDDLKKTDASILFAKYFDLGRNFYLSNNTVGYWSNPENLSYMNFGVLGLRRQFVRGYEIYVIEGPYFGFNKTTLKKLIFSRKYQWDAMPLEQFRHIPLAIYFKTYADLGYVKNYPEYEKLNWNTRLSNKLISGTGFGFDVVGSYDIVFRFEYTFNAEGENGFFFHLKREF